jgi:predicted PurR-regulated permease PerM
MTLTFFLSMLLIGLALTLRMIGPYLLALITGGILALLANPLYAKLQSRNYSPKSAAALITVGIILLVIVPISVFATLAIKQGIAVAETVSMNNNGSLSVESIFNQISQWPIVGRFIGSPAALERQARTWIQALGRTGTTVVLGVAANIPGLLLQLVLVCLACFFFLIDGKKFLSWTSDKIPLDGDVREQISNSFQNTTISVIWATLAAAAAQSTIILISFLLLGVPAAFLAAGATFIFAWIPILGSTPVWLSATLYLFFEDSVLKACLMLLAGSLTGVVDNFVRPLVLKGRSNMHPLVSLVAIFGGIKIVGIMGIFLGPILVAVVISILQIWPAVGNRFGLLPAPITTPQPTVKATLRTTENPDE